MRHDIKKRHIPHTFVGAIIYEQSIVMKKLSEVKVYLIKHLVHVLQS
jgi:hypothetical protein